VFSTTFPLSTRISFVFMNIPASPQSFPQPSFVFIEIPASYRQKKIFFSGLIGSLELQEELSD